MSFDPTKPVQLRDGREAHIYEVVGSRIHGRFRSLLGVSWNIGDWGPDGRSLGSTLCDLVNVPVEHSGWLNVYPESNGKDALGSVLHGSHEEATKASNGARRIACVRVTYKEGDGL